MRRFPLMMFAACLTSAMIERQRRTSLQRMETARAAVDDPIDQHVSAQSAQTASRELWIAKVGRPQLSLRESNHSMWINFLCIIRWGGPLCIKYLTNASQHSFSILPLIFVCICGVTRDVDQHQTPSAGILPRGFENYLLGPPGTAHTRRTSTASLSCSAIGGGAS